MKTYKAEENERDTQSKNARRQTDAYLQKEKHQRNKTRRLQRTFETYKAEVNERDTPSKKARRLNSAYRRRQNAKKRHQTLKRNEILILLSI